MRLKVLVLGNNLTLSYIGTPLKLNQISDARLKVFLFSWRKTEPFIFPVCLISYFGGDCNYPGFILTFLFVVLAVTGCYSAVTGVVSPILPAWSRRGGVVVDLREKEGTPLSSPQSPQS